MTDHVINTNFDRVTDVLFAFSGLTKVDASILQKAANRGTLIHDACDCIMEDIPHDDIPIEYQGYIHSFNSWMEKEDRRFLPKPNRFYCEELKLTGECDGLYEIGGKITLFDLKTPAKEGSTWCLQGTAYYEMAMKLGIHIDCIEFVKLEKNGNIAKSYFYKPNWEEFEKLLYVYRMYFKGQMQNLTDF